MSKTKFTPGPWRKSFTSVDCGRGRYINQIWWKHKDVAEAEANAALIAAAPEMYDFLEKLVNQIEENGLMQYDRIHNGENWVLEWAKELLCKARGESEVESCS